TAATPYRFFSNRNLGRSARNRTDDGGLATVARVIDLNPFLATTAEVSLPDNLLRLRNPATVTEAGNTAGAGSAFVRLGARLRYRVLRISCTTAARRVRHRCCRPSACSDSCGERIPPPRMR